MKKEISNKIKEPVDKLLNIFTDSFINGNAEFIAVPETNLYFLLETCKTKLDVKCKVLEWFSRDACKSMHFESYSDNLEYQEDIREKINEFLGTDFSKVDMFIIYCKLGNNINRPLCIDFIKSGYNINLLKGE